MTVNVWISWIAAQSNACISICSNRYRPLFLHGYSLDLSFVLASWSLAQGIWILWHSLKFCSISWARLRIPFSKGAWGRCFLDYDPSLATIDDHSISLLLIIEIDASLGSHSKLQVIIIKDFDSTKVWLLSSISPAFSCAPLLARLFQSLLFLLQGECARSGNFCILITYEMFLCFDGLLSLPQQMLEFHRRMWMLISTGHIWLFLDMVIVVRTSLSILLYLPHSVRFIFSNI